MVIHVISELMENQQGSQLGCRVVPIDVEE